MVREMLTGVRTWALHPFCDEPPICLAQRMAGQLITQETWPGSTPQTHPSNNPMALPMAGRYKRVPWPLPTEAVGLVSSMLQLHPAQRPSAASALQHDYFIGVAGSRRTRCHQKQMVTPFKVPRQIQAVKAAAAAKHTRPSAPQEGAFHTPPRAHAHRRQAPGTDASKQAKARPARPAPWALQKPAETGPASSRLTHAGPPGPVTDRLAEPAGTEPAPSRLMPAGCPEPTRLTDRLAEPAGPEPASSRLTPADPTGPALGQPMPGEPARPAPTAAAAGAKRALLTETTGPTGFPRPGPSAAAAPDATDAPAPQDCQCKGYCGNGPPTHCWVAGSYAQCTSQLPPLPGFDPPLCSKCACTTVGCTRQRRRGPFCFHHARLAAHGKFDELTAPLRLMRMLEIPLGKLLPTDVKVFLEVARAKDHPAVLIILAQLWVPQAVRCFAACLSRRTASAGSASSRPRANGANGARLAGGRGQGLTPAQLAAAVADTAQSLADHPQKCAESLACQQALAESGMQRLFGIGPVAQRLGVLEKRPGGRMALRKTGGNKACKQLLALRDWGQPKTTKAFCTAVMRADADLKSLGSWARLGGTYLRPHVLRKIALLWHQQGAPNIKFDDVPRSVWEACSPDQGQHLQCIPRSWSPRECCSIAPRVPVILYSMWACLLAVALREPGAEELMASPQAASVFRAEAAKLLRDAPVAPTPRQVIQAMLAAKGNP